MRWFLNQYTDVFLVLMLAVNAKAAIQPCLPFEDGDTVCFIGDSITHAGEYVKVLRDFYVTQYPQKKIRLINCGISGDALPQVLARFDSDISVHKPTVVYVMMGMNDVGMYRFKRGQKIKIKEDDGAVGAYTQRLGKLLEKIKTLNPRQIVLMSPTIYDETVKSKLFAMPFLGCDTALSMMAQSVHTIASEKGYGFVDLHAAMLEWTAKLQHSDPAMSLINFDRIHPNTLGHYLMAYQILKAKGYLQSSSKSMLVKMDKDSLSESIKLETLPLPLSPALHKTPGIAQLFEPVSKMMCQFTGILAGRYDLEINDQFVGQFTSKECEEGIDLAIPLSPVAILAVKVFSLNAHMQYEIVQRLRNPLAGRAFLGYERKNKTPLPADDIEAAMLLLKSGKRGYVAGLYRNLVSFGSVREQEKAKGVIDDLGKQVATEVQPLTLTLKFKQTEQNNALISKTIKTENGMVGYEPVAITMTDAWPKFRLNNHSREKRIGINGNHVNMRKAYLAWRFPENLKPDAIRKVTLLFNEDYSQKLKHIVLREVTTHWQAQAVNYYHAPDAKALDLCQATPANGQWVFSSEQLTAVVRRWVNHPDTNHGLMILTTDWQGHGAFSCSQKPPVLIVE